MYKCAFNPIFWLTLLTIFLSFVGQRSFAYDPLLLINRPDLANDARYYEILGLNPDEVKSQILFAVLSRAANLPVIPTYPAISADGRRLAFRPKIFNAQTLPPPADLLDWQLAEYIEIRVLEAILSIAPQEIVVVQQHLVPVGLSSAFKKFKFSEHDLAFRFQNDPYFKFLSTLNYGQNERTLYSFNWFLYRLESLPFHEIAPLVEAIPSEYKNTASQLKKRLLGIRNEFRSLILKFTSSSEQFQTSLDFLYKPASASPPYIKIPRVFDSHPSSMNENHSSPELKLWSWYFSESQHPSVSSVINKLNSYQQLATEKQSEVFFVAPASLLGDNTQIPQILTRTDNTNLTIALPLDNSESKVIRFIAEKSGAQVFGFASNEVLRVTKLNSQHVNQIIQFAKDRKCTRIKTIELPGESPLVESAFEKDFDFEPIDHHRSTLYTRSHPFSSLEQVAEKLGYELGFYEKLLALKDRGGISGATELLPFPEEFLKSIRGLIPAKELAETLAFDTDNGAKIFFLKNTRRPLMEWSIALNAIYYPTPVNLIAVSSSGSFRVSFVGTPAFSEKLKTYFEVHLPFSTSHLAGGDFVHSAYWSLGFDTKENWIRNMSELYEELEGYIKTNEPSDFWEQIIKKFYFPRGYFSIVRSKINGNLVISGESLQDLFNIEDSKIRVSLLRPVRWTRLTADSQILMLNQSSQLRDWNEITQFLRVARESGDPRWLPWLNQIETEYAEHTIISARRMSAEAIRAAEMIVLAMQKGSQCLEDLKGKNR